MFDFSLKFCYSFHIHIFDRFLSLYNKNAIPIAMFVISNLCASVQGVWTVTDRYSLLECSASLAEYDYISLTRIVLSTWRHDLIALYLLVWFAFSSCRCIVIVLDAHVDLCVVSWLIDVLTICFCFASSLAGF